MEFTLEELKMIVHWFNCTTEYQDNDFKLEESIECKILELEELANMDFNECEGGACKL